MTRPWRILAATLTLSLGSVVPGAAQTGSFGTITAYNGEMLRTYTATGVVLGERPRSELPALPTAIVAIGAGRRLGVRLGTTTVFLRGRDVAFALNEAGQDEIACSEVAAGARSAGSLVAGPRVGGGGSQDCRLRSSGQ